MDAVDENGRTALLLAAAAGRHRAVAVLLNDQHQQGAGAAGAVVLRSDVHFPDRSGLRALHLAARDGHTETVKVLLRCGADVHGRDGGSRTPTHRHQRHHYHQQQHHGKENAGGEEEEDDDEEYHHRQHSGGGFDDDVSSGGGTGILSGGESRGERGTLHKNIGSSSGAGAGGSPKKAASVAMQIESLTRGLSTCVALIK